MSEDVVNPGFARRPCGERRKRQAIKYARLLFVANHMKSYPKIEKPERIREIAKFLKVSERTIRRDIETVQICDEITSSWEKRQ